MAGELGRCKFVVRGKKKGTFRLNKKHVGDLDGRFQGPLEVKKIRVENKILPPDLFDPKRTYLKRLHHQINGTYDYEFYDGCAVLCRRLMETLIIEAFVTAGRADEIKKNGTFFGLDEIIKVMTSDRKFAIGRNSPKTMQEVKKLGDTAAHDRTYITRKQDIDDIKLEYRKLISELATIAKVEC